MNNKKKDINHRHNMPKLYFYYSAMNGGKSTTLLQSAFNYEERGMNVRVLLPAVVGKTHIESRIGLTRKANVFFPESTLAFVPDDCACVLVDEAQFLTRQQVDDLCVVVDQLHVPVLCYGLRTDFQGNLFEGSQALLGLADELIEIKTICECGRKATMNRRLGDNGEILTDGNQIKIGGNETYVSMCRRCFSKKIEFLNE